jgi:hypothetical protein
VVVDLVRWSPDSKVKQVSTNGCPFVNEVFSDGLPTTSIGSQQCN